MRNPVLEQAEQRYIEVAIKFGGTRAELLNEFKKLVRREARSILRDNPQFTKREIADQFRDIAQRCYQVAQKEQWTNDYALDVADQIRKTIMSVSP